MKTKDFIEKLKELDPSGEAEVLISCGCYNNPVMVGHFYKGFEDDEDIFVHYEDTDEGEEETLSPAILITADN